MPMFTGNGVFVADSYLKIEINCATIQEDSLLYNAVVELLFPAILIMATK
jgi:hypothetical protein